MPRTIIEYRIFIASPGGLDDIRKAFREEIQDYNDTDALRRGIIFTPVGWEETIGGARRAQELINQDLHTCDLMVLVLWNRWGHPPDNSGRFTSGSEEEFYLAMALLEQEDHQMSDVMVFFGHVPPSQREDAGPQLEKVLEFRETLEREKRHLFVEFNDASIFREKIRKKLAALVFEHERRWRY